MKRWIVRGTGIVVGALLATILSLALKSGMLHIRSMPASISSEADRTGAVDPPREPMLESKPDPGSRRALASMVKLAKEEPAWLQDFELTERSGRRVRSQDLLGQPYIAGFFFTTCPGTCKRQSDQMRLLQTAFRNKPIRLVSITVDPDIDTPAVLGEYAQSYEADKEKWLFLTGALDDIVRVGTEKFFLHGVERRGHPDRFCLVNAEGDVVGSYVWLRKEEREELIAHANELLATGPTSKTLQ